MALKGTKGFAILIVAAYGNLKSIFVEVVHLNVSKSNASITTNYVWNNSKWIRSR